MCKKQNRNKGFHRMVDMTLASIDFSMSGKGQAGVGGGMTLAQAQQLAVKSGYVKTGDTSKPLAQVRY